LLYGTAKTYTDNESNSPNASTANWTTEEVNVCRYTYPFAVQTISKRGDVFFMKKLIIFSFIALILCCLNIQLVLGQEIQEQPKSREGGQETETQAFFKAEKAEVPIIMYHLVTKNGRYIGKHGITPDELESDLKYLKDNGYQTVVMSDLVAFVKKGKNLPDKPIVLTFDDGNSSDYRYLYPLLQKYGMKAVISVLGKASDECTVLASKVDEPPILPNLTWGQIKEMHESKLVEVQNHSYDLHGGTIGSAQRQGESVENYHRRLREDLTKLQERIKEMTGAEPNTFTYPLGRVSENAQEVIEELGLVASLSCRSGINILTEDDMACLYLLKRDNRPSGVPVSTILQRINDTKNKK